ncbi:20821_t:CDS:1 [Racocetra persica]|uniref:20821_t:CDS:1 n=1 Tax=Racocetra persica TaxID=160502 RepID=A0ACA9PRH5_9GLOM|nr:20821_t:CDS:1 [Racocetra persica]
MPMSSLPVDCVTIILENLRYDPGCLFSCLLINRSWCRVTVPILWSDPFSIFGEKFGRNIIRSYLICLDYENKLNLIKNGINISLSENPLFGYHKYLQFLEYELLNHLVRSWMIENEHFKYFDITLYEESSVSKHQFCLIMSILCKLFMENCSIKSFRLSKSWRHLDIPDISMFSSGNLGLTKTRELEICFTEDESIMPNTAKLLRLLSSLCTELRSLSIILPMTTELRDMSEFYDLFKAQRNLKRFKLCWSRQIFDNFLRVMNSQVNPQINTTLTSLQLHRIKLDNLSLDALEFCSCLKTFKIINLCEDLTLTPQCLSSSFVYFFKSFYFWSNCNMSAQSTAAIIKKAGRSLQKLHLDLITSDTVDAILNYCPNISILKIYNKDDNDNINLCKLLSGMKGMKLKKLDLVFNSAFTSKLGRILPLSLDSLTLLDVNPTFYKFLEEFLNGIQAQLSSLTISFLGKCLPEILKVIRDYVKSKNVLKTLNFTSHPLRYMCEKELNDILVMKQELHENVNVLLDYSKDYYNLEMAA